MKLLKLDPMYRHYLTARRALTLDSQCNETLVGLTVTESSEYLLLMKAGNDAGAINGFADAERMVVLYDRHTAALPQAFSVFDALLPSIW